MVWLFCIEFYFVRELCFNESVTGGSTMKIFAYGIRDDEKLILEEWKSTNPGVEVNFTGYDLTSDSAFLADDADGIVTMQNAYYSRDALEILNKLGIHNLSTRTTNIANFNFKDLKELGFKLTNVPDYCASSIAEHVIVLMGQLLQQQPQFTEKMHQGDFTLSPNIGQSFSSQTIGVIGTGRTGLAVIKLLQALGSKVIAYDIEHNSDLETQGLYADHLSELYQKSDVITLQLPLTSNTRYLINDSAIKQMKSGVILINCAHGQLLDTDALIKGLDSGQIAGAGLDVLDDETSVFGKIWSSLKNIPNGDIRDLLQRNNVVITPHNAFYTQMAVRKMIITAFDSNKALIEGKTPSTIVDLDK
jgi:Lactate dehydrogenase and related dehydrogenases